MTVFNIHNHPMTCVVVSPLIDEENRIPEKFKMTWPNPPSTALFLNLKPSISVRVNLWSVLYSLYTVSFPKAIRDECVRTDLNNCTIRYSGGGNNFGLNNQGLGCGTIPINNAAFPGSSSSTEIPILSRVKTQTAKLRGFCLISSLSQVQTSEGQLTRERTDEDIQLEPFFM